MIFADHHQKVLHLCGMSLSDHPPFPFPELSLPTFEFRIQFLDQKWWIFDLLRKKSLVLTPEEWVRQHWIQFLTIERSFPKGLFSIEKGLKYNGLQKRTDVLIFDRVGAPYLLIECKAPEIEINQNVLHQAMTYHQKIKSPHLILTNGIKHLVFSWSDLENRLVQRTEIPKKPE